MKRKQTNATKSKLDARAVRQMLRGYRRANKVTREEERAWLERLSIEDARQLFDALHQDAERWQREGGDLDALAHRRLADKIRGRQILMQVSTRARQR